MSQSGSMPSAPKPAGNDVEENKAMAALSYVGILVLIPLLAKKDSPFAQYHAKQGLVLFIAEIITIVVNIIPFLGQLLFVVAWIVWIVLAIMGIMAALKGEQKELPILGGFAAKIKM